MLVPMKVDYGVRLLVYLAQQPEGAYISTGDIARAQHVPEPYLLHICADLQKAGMINSRRGPQGGHKLARSAEEITISDVVNSLDRSLAPLECVEEPDDCRLSGACSQRLMWSDVEKMLMEHLSHVKVSDLARRQTAMSKSLLQPVTLATG
ncbi:MAG: Rrf2 family transcriptional regulator [Dehalococcoidia bacterium]|nr:Rrf2 family transcriptional regulator [Dehalococcoidia bacterium]MSQ34258.1 Rrf2 family transcriptional regulator [Dehalococcoidia bacterium]